MNPKTQALEILSALYDVDTAQQTVERLWSIFPETPENVEPATPRNDCMLITYADSIQAEDEIPLQTLGEFLNTHLNICGRVHLLPFYPSSSDDGFAVIDYRMVDHHVGGWGDIEPLAARYDLMFDLVINHCSRENLWFADFVGGSEPGRNFFITLPEESDTSAVARPRSTPLISPIHTYAGIRHVWNTFSSDQIDLDFSNPDVLCEFVAILMFYIQRGARLLRLDAIGYLWKRLGTSCLNLPETHLVVKLLRLLLDEAAPWVRIITETNVPHEENIAYFGAGDEAHLVYQFSLAPLLLYTFTFGDSRYLQRWGQNLDTPPAGATYLNFFASHDGIGLRPLEGLVPDPDVDRLVARMHERGGFATLRDSGGQQQRPYEINISLMSAFGGADGLPAYLAAHALMLSFQGSPALYIHSFLGTENDLDLVEQTGRTRSINRRKWQLQDLLHELADPTSLRAQTLEAMRELIAVRNSLPALACEANQTILITEPNAFALRRKSNDQEILVVANITPQPVKVAAGTLGLDPGTYNDHLGDEVTVAKEMELQAYAVCWLDVPA
ncbi:MAG: alpha-amylase family glycosyl hydrolase [Pseudomonadota bacterium]